MFFGNLSRLSSASVHRKKPRFSFMYNLRSTVRENIILAMPIARVAGVQHAEGKRGETRVVFIVVLVFKTRYTRLVTRFQREIMADRLCK